MPFGDNLEALLPQYLVEPDKSRLKDALEQFQPQHRDKEIDYSIFYRDWQTDYFLQADLIRDIRMPEWDEDSETFLKTYRDAIIVSNTCDISYQNHRDLNIKQCLLAPLVDLSEFKVDLRQLGYSHDQIATFDQNVRKQLISNIFFLPQHYTGSTEYIVMLDKIFWLPTSELNSYLNNLYETRIASMNHYGFYLFILKLSYHLCRVPEQCDRVDL